MLPNNPLQMSTAIARPLLLFVICCTANAKILVGLAEVDITPPPGGLTTGYASAKPTDGVHDPVSARVVLLKSELDLVDCWRFLL